MSLSNSSSSSKTVAFPSKLGIFLIDRIVYAKVCLD
jgi:hypothetical protein